MGANWNAGNGWQLKYGQWMATGIVGNGWQPECE